MWTAGPRPAGVLPAATPGGVMARRLEVKYFLDRTRRSALARDLRAFMRPDVFAGPDGSYIVRSLYFDTPDYQAYHDKLAGAAERHKLRVRAYGVDPGRAAFVRLEVKSRYLGYIHKTVADVAREDYPAFEQALRRRTLPPAAMLERYPAAREFFRIQRQLNMEPKILIQYRRQAFERLEVNRTRVNFDDELVASRTLDLLGPCQAGGRLMKYGGAIIEIKVDNVLPFWLHTLIGKYELRNEAISKYCYAVRSQARMSAVAREVDE
jgi:hypothetical protein